MIEAKLVINMIKSKKFEKEIANNKSERILEGVAYWAAFYRL